MVDQVLDKDSGNTRPNTERRSAHGIFFFYYTEQRKTTNEKKKKSGFGKFSLIQDCSPAINVDLIRLLIMGLKTNHGRRLWLQ